MKRKKKKLVWMAACIALAAALGGCMETPEDSCIVKEKETETGKIFSGNESEENVSIAEQVQAGKEWQQEIREGDITVGIKADIEMPAGNSMKIYTAQSRWFTQGDLDGWLKLLTQGQPLKDYDTGEVLGWKPQEELSGVVSLENRYASWSDTENKNYIFEMQNIEENGEKKANLELRREENSDYVPWNHIGNGTEPKTKTGRKQMKKAADRMLEELGLSKELQYIQAETVYCMTENVYTDGAGGLVTEERPGWRFYYTRTIEDAAVTHVQNKVLSEGTLEGLNFDLENSLGMGNDHFYSSDSEENWETNAQAESFCITFDEEGLVDVAWMNPVSVEANEGDGIFLLPFSDILQVFQKSITKQYILELFADRDIPAGAQVTEIRLGYQRVETQDKDGKNGKEQMIPVWDFIGTYDSETAEQILENAGNIWGQCYLKQKKTDSLLTINATDGTVVDWGNDL